MSKSKTNVICMLLILVFIFGKIEQKKNQFTKNQNQPFDYVTQHDRSDVIPNPKMEQSLQGESLNSESKASEGMSGLNKERKLNFLTYMGELIHSSYTYATTFLPSSDPELVINSKVIRSSHTQEQKKKMSLSELSLSSLAKTSRQKTLLTQIHPLAGDLDAESSIWSIVGEEDLEIKPALKTISPSQSEILINEQASLIQERIIEENTSFGERSSGSEINSNFQNFRDVCKAEISNPDNFIIGYFAFEFVDFDNKNDASKSLNLLSKVKVHTVKMATYQSTLGSYQKLVDDVYMKYVPARLLKLLSLFYDQMSMKDVCKVILASSDPRTTEYVREWQNMSINLDQYFNFGQIFYGELLIQNDTDLQKTIDSRINQMESKVSKLVVSNAKYKEDLEELNGCVCATLKEIVYNFAGQVLRVSSFKAKFEEVSINPDIQKAQFKEYAIKFFNAFSQTLTSFSPKKCGVDPITSIREMIFYARTDKFLTDPSLSLLQKSITIPDNIWTSFFGMFSSIKQSFFRTIIEYDSYILDTNTMSDSLFDQMLKYRETTIPFHPEFFQLMVNIKTYSLDVQILPQQISILELKLYFINWEKNEIEEEANKSIMAGRVFIRDIWVYLYKIYMFLRAEGHIKQKSTLKQIFEEMCKFLQEKSFFDTKPSQLYLELFEQASYSSYYPHLASYLAELAAENGVTECIKSEIAPVLSSIPAKSPGKPFIKIHKIIIFYFQKLIIEEAKTNFKKELIKIGWSVSTCPTGKMSKFDYEKSDVNFKTVVTKKYSKATDKLDLYKKLKERKVYRYIPECVNPFFTKFDLVLREFGLKPFKDKPRTEKIHEDIIRIILEVADEQVYESKGLMMHVIIRWISSFRVVKTKIDLDIQKLVFLMFEVVENRVLKMLNYYEVAGFYGLLSRVLTGDNEANVRKSSKKNLEWARFENLMRLKDNKRDLLRTDIFYLVHQAILLTAPEKGKEKIFQTNIENAKELSYLMFTKIGVYETDVLKQKAGLDLDSYKENIYNCRRNLFLKEGKKVDEKECQNNECQMAENTFALCDINFALKIIGYLHSMPIMIYSVPVFDTHNYFHKYFTKVKFGSGLSDKTTLTKLYRQLQVIRLSTDAQVSDIPYFVLDRVMECVTETSIFGAKRNQKAFCIFSPRTYANMYWIMKFTFVVNYSYLMFDLNFYDNKLPVFGTTELMLNVFTYPEMETEFDGICNEIMIKEPMVPICKLKSVIKVFISISGNSDHKALDPNDLFDQLNEILESKVSDSLHQTGRFIVLEALYVLEQLDGKYQKGNNEVMSILNYRSFMSAFEETNAKKYNQKYDLFLIDQTKLDQVKLFQTYLYYSNIKKRIKPIEQAFRDAITTIGCGPNLGDIAKYKSHNMYSIYKMLLMYSPNIQFTECIANKLIENKVFLAVAIFEIENDLLNMELNDLQTSCPVLSIGCFYQVILRMEIKEEFEINTDQYHEIALEFDLKSLAIKDDRESFTERLEQLNLEEFEFQLDSEFLIKKKIQIKEIKRNEVNKNFVFSNMFEEETAMYTDGYSPESYVSIDKDSIYGLGHYTIDDFNEDDVDPALAGTQKSEKLIGMNPDETDSDKIKIENMLKGYGKNGSEIKNSYEAKMAGGAFSLFESRSFVVKVEEKIEEYEQDFYTVETAYTKAGLSQQITTIKSFESNLRVGLVSL